MDEYLGVIKMFAGNYEPIDYMFCNGQILQISQYQALYVVIGTTYGGNGQTTFQLPDLRGRAPICYGSGTNLDSYTLGQTGGSESIVLSQAQMPNHSHALAVTVQIPVNSGGVDTDSPESTYIGASGTNMFNSVAGTDQFAGAAKVTSSLAAAGGSAPFDNRSPFIAMNYIICVNGIFPSRP